MRRPTYPIVAPTATLALQTNDTVSVNPVLTQTKLYLALLHTPMFPVWQRCSWQFQQYQRQIANPGFTNDNYTLTYSFPWDPTYQWFMPKVLDSRAGCEAFVYGRRNQHTFIYLAAKKVTIRITKKTPTVAANAVEFNFVLRELLPDGTESERVVTLDATSAGTDVYGVYDTESQWVRCDRFTMRKSNGDTVITGDWWISVGYTTSLIFDGVPDVDDQIQCWMPFQASLPPIFSQASAPFQSCRVTAAGMRINNVTAMLNKEGTVRAARALMDSYPFWYNTVDPLDKAPSNNLYFGALAHGLQTYTLPSNQSTPFKDHVVDVSRSLLAKPCFDLDYSGYYNLVELVDESAATPTKLAITYVSHLEFMSNSQLFPVAFSKQTLESFHSEVRSASERLPFQRLPPLLEAPKREVPQQSKKAQKQKNKKQSRKQEGKKGKSKSAQSVAKPPAKQRLKSGLQMYLDSKKPMGGKGGFIQRSPK